MNVFNYIDKYGEYTFEEKHLTEIDKLIFALLSYVKYDNCVSSNSFDKRRIQDIGETYFNNTTRREIKSNILSIRLGIRVLDKIRNTNRFKDLYMFNDIYIGDERKQFSAICIEIRPKLIYVSFEGTDQLISGWEEDGALIYQFPVPAQRRAIRYLDEHFTFRDCKLIVGGHSKGGNLALVSSMYANFIVRSKIVEVYSYDGPGLRTAQLNSFRYKMIRNRFNRVIPNSSVVGVILLHEKGRVIKAKGLGFITHNPATWQVNDEDFIDTELTNFSKMLESTTESWIRNYSEQERKHFIDQVFELFKKNNIVSLIDIKKNFRLIITILKDLDNVDNKTKEMARKLVDILIEYNKQKFKLRFSFKKSEEIVNEK